jgi:hypothetical protein
MTTQTPPMSSTIPARYGNARAIQFPNARLTNVKQNDFAITSSVMLGLRSGCASERPRHIQTHNANLELLKMG